MPRARPGVPPRLPATGANRKPLLDLEIAIVTPLFGGGTTAEQFDPERPVSGQSVRGHLRFWWRACYAPAFATPDALFAAESALWGAVGDGQAAGPSALDVRVEIVSAGKQETNQRGRRVWKQGYPGYALFPFQESNQKKTADPCLTGVVFRLVIEPARHVTAQQASDLEASVKNAARAWLAFGGLGARTRRGCGSLWCATKGFMPTSFDDIQDWARKLAHTGNHNPPVPRLSGARIVLGSRPTDPLRAWNEAVRTLQQFRRGNSGASLWPEAQAIRNAAQGQDPGAGYFPRADLGMPILFQQMGIDPPPQLTPSFADRDRDRMASPLIVKPLALAQDKAVPMVMLLNAPHIWEMDPQPVTLKVGNDTYRLTSSQIFDVERSRNVPPLLENKDPRARRAFLNFAAQRLRAREVEV